FSSAMVVVKGTFLGQTCTQFWELPQSTMPPFPMMASKRWCLSICPSGCMLNKRTWEKGAAPIKSDLLLTLGQASKQQPQVMQRDSWYASFRWCSDWRGPRPRSKEPSILTQAFTFFKCSNII